MRSKSSAVEVKLAGHNKRPERQAYGRPNSKPNGMPCSSQSSFKAVGTSVNKVAVEAAVRMAIQEIGKAAKYAVW